ncbi:hypothetical protein [Enterococcus saccharolyticus]|uniref:L-lactate dehydrogenase n=1 Tax=Enterococcus saccharolyticus subsp. saccharolyticus ATCC 43076 TaxID=1139996 RepID=S0N541_9ENTE|nr:hypothetical protein [Enterococcus saccharolyticus]EOT26437.1 hypothetical protein OMQ_02212 [Enterococcus saccharolyticus subsp. saccharolyticus ATCC 43076]EOT76397.1 hypothetical protein I572_02585 [Enterococcus saccharolyticus subsp. saccharolyticus ATCC 43076]
MTGSGAIGLVTLLALKSLGLNEIYVVDIMDNRLAKAKELDVTAVINGKQVIVIGFGNW